jgi:hypothetical protein
LLHRDASGIHYSAPSTQYEVVKGDTYNTLKYILITWIGSNVPPGIAKARCAGNRVDVLEFVQKSLAIAGEFQPVSKADMNHKTIADKLTRVAQHEVKEHHEPPRSPGSNDRSKSQLKVNIFFDFSISN